MIGRIGVLLAPVVAAVVLAGLSGCAVGPSAVAELNRPGTDADRLPEEWGTSSGVFPGTARVVGTLEETEIYVGVGASGTVRTDVHFCLIAVDRGGASATCGRLPLTMQAAGRDVRLVGSGAEVPAGYRPLSDSVIVSE